MKKYLVVLAAGIGSRFWGVKQIAKVGLSWETLLDYTLQDAIKAWFTDVVYVIRKDIEVDFCALIGDRYANQIITQYAYQEIQEPRSKPYGTWHGLLCAKDLLDAPFLLINADDYYGLDSMMQASKWLDSCMSNEFAMVGFVLQNTLSENGGVNRGICGIEDGKLASIVETFWIQLQNWVLKDKAHNQINPEDIASMNFWMFHPDTLQALWEHFSERATQAEPTQEYFIWLYCNYLIDSGRASCDVLVAKDNWYGITFKEDLPIVRAALLDR